MIFIYRFFYFLLKVLVTVLKPVLPPHLKNWIVLRGQVLNKSKIDTKSYWFHASSGEIEYCKYVIRKLKESEPYCRIVVTYSSPSAEKLFANIKDVVSEFIPLPWDQAGPLSELFDYINPQILVFSRTDLWPELLHQAQIRKINTGVIAFNPKSDFLSLLSYKLFLQTLTFASCVDLALAENLKALLPSTHVSADGDTRFDQVFYRLSQEPKLNLKSESKILVLGSTWPDDERIILKNLAELKSQQIKIVLSPHEVQPDNIARLRNILSLQGLSFRCLSEFDSFIDFKFDVLI
ncbi:MAG: 3-deoxy-D-manno-octulosonic acid transferase, partial [Pseudobdellovibrio sp.]